MLHEEVPVQWRLTLLLRGELQSIRPYIYILLLRAAPEAHGGSQARDLIGAIAASLRHSHSNAGSESRLPPTPQFTATPDP